MLNILRTFQLGFHRFFSLYLCSAWNRRDRDASTAQLHKTPPNTRKLQPRSDPTTWDKGRGKRQNRGGRYHKSPNDATVKLSTRKRELKQLFHTPLLAANYSNANISGVPYW